MCFSSIGMLGWITKNLTPTCTELDDIDIDAYHRRHYPDTCASIERYRKEHYKRAAILQRINRLSQPVPTKTQSPEDDDHHHHPPSYAEPATTEEEDRKLEIHQLRAELRLAVQQILQLYEEIPNNEAREILDLRTTRRDSQGRTDLWHQDSVLCRSSGGCCGRACGCCEKPVDEYYRLNKITGKKELFKLYGHCTAECVCCIKTHGIYDPDPRLPKPIVRLEFETISPRVISSQPRPFVEVLEGCKPQPDSSLLDHL
ncbi:hypothetical protein BDV18DRAFT_133271 [Aspergillus unguis]